MIDDARKLSIPVGGKAPQHPTETTGSTDCRTEITSNTIRWRAMTRMAMFLVEMVMLLSQRSTVHCQYHHVANFCHHVSQSYYTRVQPGPIDRSSRVQLLSGNIYLRILSGGADISLGGSRELDFDRACPDASFAVIYEDCRARRRSLGADAAFS